MPNADDDERHEHNRPVRPKHVDQNLRHRLSHRPIHRPLKILYGKQERKQQKEAKHRTRPNADDNPQRRTPARVLRLLAQMRARIEARQRILRHQYPARSHIRRRRPDTPPRIARPIIKRRKYKPGTLVRRRLGQHRNGQRPNPQTMQNDTRIVQKPQNVHAKGIHHPMANQQSRIDANRLARARRVSRVQRRRRRDEAGAAKGDAGRDGHLAQQGEPARHPGGEGGPAGGCKHSGPEVRAAGGGDRGDDLGHAEADDQREEGDDDPADGHDARAAGGETVGEEGCYAGYDGLGRGKERG